MQKTQVQPLGQEMAISSSILAWGNPMDRGAWQATVYGVAKCLSIHTKHKNGRGKQLEVKVVGLSFLTPFS